MEHDQLYCIVCVILKHPNWEFDLCFFAVFPFFFFLVVCYFNTGVCVFGSYFAISLKKSKERERYELHPKATSPDLAADEHCVIFFFLLHEDSQTHKSVTLFSC